MKKKKSLMAVSLMLSILTLTACGSDSEDNSIKENIDNLKIGFISAEDENNAETLLHINGLKNMAESVNLSEKKIIKKTDVTEENCYETATELVEQGCNLIFASGSGLEDYVLQSATENPNVQFCFADGNQAATTELENFHNYSVAESESRYVSGVVAGKKLNDMIDNGEIANDQIKIGYVGSVSNSENVSAYTAFYLGAKSVCPNVILEVQYAGLENNAKLESIAANALIANGSILIAQHSYTNGAAETCEKNNIYFIGNTVSAIDTAPDFALTSSYYDWSSCYIYAVDCIKNGKSIPAEWSKGYETSACGITEINKSAFTSDEKFDDAKKTVSAVEKTLEEKTVHVFDTTTWAVDGKSVTTTVSDELSGDYYGVEFIGDGYFKEYELSSSPHFAFRIDGITELN